jgi:hypothetical protein
MRRRPAWLAVGLILFVLVGCNLGRKTADVANNKSPEPENTSQDASSTGAISEIYMAKDDGNGDPGDKASVFGENDRTIHCVTKLNNPKPGTNMKFTWWVVEAAGAQNEKIRDIDFSTRALEDVVHGHLTPPNDWPPGKYKVEVYVNGNLERTVGYIVE